MENILQVGVKTDRVNTEESESRPTRRTLNSSWNQGGRKSVEQSLKNENLLSIGDLSEYLRIKPKTLYSKVESGEIPHYKIGHLIRFRKSEVEAWLERSRKTSRGVPVRVKRNVKVARSGIEMDRLVQKTIDESKRGEYTSDHGKSDRTKGLGKEVENGDL